MKQNDLKDFGVLRTETEDLLEETSIGRLSGSIERIRDLIGIRHIMYVWINRDGAPFYCGTYPAEWIRFYVE